MFVPLCLSISYNQNNVSQAVQRGRKLWNRSRMLIVGEGRGGKTTLMQQLLGQDFQMTPSTRGITKDLFDLTVSQLQNYGMGDWQPGEEPEKQLEAAIASMLLGDETQQQELRKDKMTVPSSDSSIQTPPTVASVAIEQTVIPERFKEYIEKAAHVTQTHQKAVPLDVDEDAVI